MMRFFLLLSLTISALSTSHAQTDTLWIVPGGVGLGGDTLAAVDKYNIADCISYISTGGGAFLEFLEGKTLPAVAMLERRASQK